MLFAVFGWIALAGALCWPFLLYRIISKASKDRSAGVECFCWHCSAWIFVSGCLQFLPHSLLHKCFASGETDRTLWRHPCRCLLNF